MILFLNDYSEGAHPRVLEGMQAGNLSQCCGYGLDEVSLRAHERVRALIGCPEADVHLLVGGTSANLIALTAFLRPHEAVVCADCGHINTHETGAVEGAGHKILSVPAENGKLTAGALRAVVATHTDEHMVRPRVAFISNASELGTVYGLDELRALRAACDELGMYLYMDGARLCSALASEGCDVTFADLPRLCDAFYIGGTKNGALLGEAMVVVHPALKPDFRYLIKNRGGMLAKGFVVGRQFDVLLADGLCMDLARHADAMAQIVRAALTARGVPFFVQTATNQLFPILTQAQMDFLSRDFGFQVWSPLPDGRTAVRFVTSWATPEQNARALADAITRMP